jgi:tRNA wybutosine-synthesizing protein 4
VRFCRRAHTATALDSSRILIFGGFGIPGDQGSRSKSRPSASHARLASTELLTITAAGEVTLASLKLDFEPEPRLYHSAVEVRGNAYLFGGRQGPRRPFNDMYLLDGSSLRWSPIERQSVDAAWPSPRFRHATAVLGSRILVHGGIGAEGDVLSDAWLFDLDSCSWTRVHDLDSKSGLHSHQIVVLGQPDMSFLVLFLGGRTPEGEFADVESVSWAPPSAFEPSSSHHNRIPPGSHLETALFRRYGSKVSICSNAAGRLLVSGGIAPPAATDNKLATEPLCLVNFTEKGGDPFPVSLDAFKPRLFIDHTVNVLSVESPGGVHHDRTVILGGGATCFSFGSTFDDEIAILDAAHAPRIKRPALLPDSMASTAVTPSKGIAGAGSSVESNGRVVVETDTWDKPTAVATHQAYAFSSNDWRNLFEMQVPFVLRGCDLGPCLEKWTPDYLSETLASKKVGTSSRLLSHVRWTVADQVQNDDEFCLGVRPSVELDSFSMA